MNLKSINVRTEGNSSESNMDEMNRSGLMLEGKDWNLQVSVFNDGLQCPPNSKGKVPPCSGPYPNYNLKIITSEGKNISFATDSNGLFRTMLKPGSYIVTNDLTGDTSMPTNVCAEGNEQGSYIITGNPKVECEFVINENYPSRLYITTYNEALLE
jgi:hypothetical protein